jgi:peptidoglycan L-alanyl-D-glutamate endopeptidase CwlK
MKLSKRSYNHLNGIDAILIAILTEAIKESPYDFGVPNTGGLRTPSVQNNLFRNGKSKADGYQKKSYHQTGKAFDVFGYVGGKATWDKKVLTEISIHIRKVALDEFNVKLTWGGDWKSFQDMPHYQI